MNLLTISFTRDWIEEQRKNGKRVIRLLEKWITALEGISLKSSANCKLTVELQPAAREQFLKDLAQQMTALFGETAPWAHAVFSGDTAGLDVPLAGAKQCPAPQAGSEGEKEEKTEENAPAEEIAAPQNSKEQDSPKQKTPAEVVEEICSRVPIKYSKELETYVRETAEVIPMLQKMGAESSLWHQHLLMAVDAGYGRSEFLQSLVELYKTFGLIKDDPNKKAVREFILLPGGRSQEPDGYRVNWDAILDAAQDMRHSNTRNGISRAVLYIDISAWQSQLTTSEFKIRLRRLNSLCGTFLVVFRVPSIEGHVLRETADALNDILNVRTLAVPPAPISAMIDYTRSQLAVSGFQIAESALGPFEQLLLREKVDDSFFGYKTMDKVVRNMIYHKALSNCRSKVEDRTIGIDDLGFTSPSETDDAPMSELKKMIGMQQVERRINEVIVQIKKQRELAARGKSVARPSIHMLFTGNPGTGKTTVARILARIMRQAGILQKGHIIEVKGRDLCGQYVGETAPKTSAICRDAYGSVLFIDEAYSLFRDDFSSARDFGREALDTLVAEMDNHRDNLCVIMAGYKDEMDAMLKANVGLRGRIPYEIDFPNYTRDELEKIFFTMLDGIFDYEEGLKESVHKLFAEISEETLKSKEFSNARLVRNLYERTWGKAAYRQSLDGGELRILQSDLAGAMSESEFKKLLKKTPERMKMGFNA